MYSRLSIALTMLATFSLAPAALAMEGDPDACDCDTITLSEEEIDAGCMHEVKMRTCPRYREAMLWQERLRMDEKQRGLERRMEPRHAPIR